MRAYRKPVVVIGFDMVLFLLLFVTTLLTFRIVLHPKPLPKRKFLRPAKQGKAKTGERFDAQSALSKTIELVRVGVPINKAFATVLNSKVLEVDFSRENILKAVKNDTDEGAGFYGKLLDRLGDVKLLSLFKKDDLLSEKRKAELFASVSVFAFELSRRLGIPVADIFGYAINAFQSQIEKDGEIINAISGAKTTTRLLACLPAVMIAFLYISGINLFSILFDMKTGTACLILGILFFIAGLKWAQILIDKAKTDDLP